MNVYQILGLNILVSNDGIKFDQIGSNDDDNSNQATVTFYFADNLKSGRYVRIQLAKNEFLTLCEAQMWGSLAGL